MTIWDRLRAVHNELAALKSDPPSEGCEETYEISGSLYRSLLDITGVLVVSTEVQAYES